jgi:hypothetical protein
MEKSGRNYIMALHSETESSGFEFPEAFTDPSYEYSGTQRNKEKMVRADLIMFYAVSASGQRPILKEFERAMKIMGKAIGTEAFTEILGEVNDA